MTMMTPEKLRALADVLVAPIGRVTTQSLKIDLRAAASAWEADRLAGHEWAAEGKVNRARIAALEGHEAEFKWLLTHDSGDVGGIGRRQWIERRDALLPELTALPAEEKTHG